MAKQYFGAGELEKPEKVLNRVFPAGDQTARVVEPGEDAFDLPAAFGAAERAAVLRGDPATATMARDHLDAIVRAQLRVERITVVAAIADQSLGEVGEEPGVEGRRDEVWLIR